MNKDDLSIHGCHKRLLDATDRDGAGGVSVGVVCPALIVPLISRSQVLYQKYNSPTLLVVPSLLPLPLPPLHLAQRQTPPRPLDGGSRQPGHLPLQFTLLQTQVVLGADLQIMGVICYPAEKPQGRV